MALTDVKAQVADGKTLCILPMQEASATTDWDNIHGNADWDAVPVSGSEPQIESTTLPNSNFTYARIFDNNDLANIGNPSEFPTGSFTVEFMLYVDDVAGVDNEGIISRYATVGGNRVFNINRNTADKLIFSVTADGSTFTSITTTSAVTRGQWLYVACVFTAGSRMEIFVDGSSAISSTTSIPASAYAGSDDLIIGGYNTSWVPNNALDGKIVDIRISDGARTSTEISAHWGGTDASTGDVSGDATLTNSIVAHWELEEASGTRDDSYSTNHLTDNNTVLQGTGKQGNCADFELTNSEYFSIADNVALSITGDLSISCWANFESTSGQQALVAKWTGQSNQRSYMFYFESNALKFLNSDDGSTTALGSVSWTPSIATWYFLTMTYDASAGTVDFYVNGAQQGVQQSGLRTSLYDGTSELFLSAIKDGGGGATSFFDGLMDETYLTSEILNPSAIWYSYNSGDGIAYSSGGGGATLYNSLAMCNF